ncbi:hypothetical protein BGZ95_011981 [Linnemannia exigua]|uniref:Uncharacterized protein n=1 Tax=Linnemannia exigua TaxID=604196 RepID=A0AAD4DJM1_9FUNG|nr:hypothetical protein BGZ95_011981 [Linnemannia exigua]
MSNYLAYNFWMISDRDNKLPVECLERIIHFIISAGGFSRRHPLASLCQVNKCICSITTRFLYHNTHLLFGALPFNQDKNRRSRQLLQTLISCIPTQNLHPVVILGLGIDINYHDCNGNNKDTSSPSPSGLNHVYLARCLDFMVIKYTDYDVQGNNRDYTTTELDYINRQEFLDMYLTDRKDATCLKDPHSSDHLFRYYPNVVYREAIWSLAEPIFEQLERLTFLLSDLRRYHNNVDRLKNLKYLSVRFDIVFSCDCCSDTPQDEPRRQRKEETLRLLVQFVKDHVKRFPGRLETVYTYKTDYWEEYQSCPRTVCDEIYRILPAVYKPDVITAGIWPKVLVHFPTIDFGRVLRIKWLPPGIDIQLFLQRCRGLYGIDVHSLVQGCFDWAAREKKDMEIYGQGQGQGQDQASAIARVRHQDISSNFPPPPPQPAWLKHGLVKLQDVRLQVCKMPSRDLDTIATTFGYLLRLMQILDLQVADDAQTIHIHIGRDWPIMPLFFRLELQTLNYQNRLTLDPRLFGRFPCMKYAKIKDETFEDLKLTSTRPEGHCYIPPVDELDGPIGAEVSGSGEERDGILGSILRPRWSWDWHLPNLKELDLTSEFAYRFEFKMLNGCPDLEILRLHMRTAEGLHTRAISEAHLFVSEVDGSQERIVAPKLRKLYMNGRWVIENSSVLSQFLGGMFPNLERLVARGWDGVTVGSFAKAIRTTAGHITMIRTDLVGPSEEEAAELKLCLRSHIGMKTKAFLHTRLFCSGVEYVLCNE